MTAEYDHLTSKTDDKENPKKNANIFSILSFWWVGQILAAGKKRPLENEDLFPLLDEDRTQTSAEKLQRTWCEETARRVPGKKGNGYRLFRALVRMFPWSDHLFVLTLYLLFGVCNVLQPVFLSLLLQELMRSSHGYIWRAYIYAASICLSTCLYATVLHQSDFNSLLMAVRWRSATIAVVYKKVLSLTQSDLSRITSGYIINLIATDLQRFEKSTYSLFVLFVGVFQVCGVSCIIVFLFGWKPLTGIIFMILLSLYYGIAGRMCTTLRSQISKVADKRVNVMNSIISGIRTVKMYAWEGPFMEIVHPTRRREMKLIRWKTSILATSASFTLSCHTIATFISLVTMAATGMELTSYNTFTILSLVSLLMKVVTAEIGQPINDLADFSAALSRIQNTLEFEKGNIYKYLHETFAECANIESNADAFGKAGHFSKSSGKADHAVFMKDVTCSWTGSWNKLSLKSVTLSVKKGDLVFVAGSVGCGKSSLLYAILQELPLSTGKISIQGKIAWVSQQPWVFSGTIRENILFGVAFDPRRYQMVLKACALSKDLQRFPNGDMTRVGERGILLSGGQRARVELARAVYSDADIYLLDDPLSAVDTKVGHHIFNMCIDRILHDKTRLIVTHNLQIIRDAENIVVMKNGSILGKGDLPSLLRSGLDLSDMEYSRAKEGAFLPKKTALAEEENNEKDSIPDENFVGLDNVAEDREVGSISWKLYWHIIQVGAYPVLAAVLLIVFALVQASLILPDWWLLQLTSRSHDHQRQTKDLYIYGYLVCAAVLLSVMRAFAFLNTLINSSRNIHNTMLSVVLKAPILFFDTNPAGRVLNRFSRDIGILDELLPDSFLNAAQFVLFAFAAVVLQSLLNPWIILPAIPVAVICLLCGRYYLKSSRDLRRLEAISRSPVLSHFSDTLEGLVSIRAYKREDAFLQDLYRYQDEHNKTWFAILSTNRWLGMRLDIVCVIFVAFVIVFAVGTHGGSGITALAVVYALQLVGTLQYGVKKCAEVENYMTSVERVLTYTQIDPEPGYENQNQPPKDWPLYGEVRTKDLGLVYYQGGPKVLKDVSFTIDPHEKVGIVGRTGAGKSSLIAALFRMPQPTGDVVIDDVNIGDINIQSARRAVAVITQNPVLFTGSLRMNLDPFDEYEDKELWDALEEANLKNMVRNLPRQLNEEVKECGANLSVGERQLLCLARALLKKNKIIVMDEATANVDHKTDQLIQDTIRTKFKHCTVITIAHRLNTIMNYDRVLVLENGRVVEYDKPEILLRNQSGVFSGLCHYYMGSDKVEK